MKVGDFVKMPWDDGRGGDTCYGIVVKAGTKAITIVWESGIRNRVRRSDLRDIRIQLIDKDGPARECAIDATRRVRQELLDSHSRKHGHVVGVVSRKAE